MRDVVALLLLTGLAACGLDGTVGSDAHLLVPDDVTLHWDASFNRTDDGLALLLPVDVMVYDGATGEPIEAVPIELRGNAPGALLVPSDAVALVGFDESTETVWWDAWRDRYFELALAPSSQLVVETDATGLARVYVFVDRFAVEADRATGPFLPAPVTVTMGETEESFLLVPR